METERGLSQGHSHLETPLLVLQHMSGFKIYELIFEPNISKNSVPFIVQQLRKHIDQLHFARFRNLQLLEVILVVG